MPENMIALYFDPVSRKAISEFFVRLSFLDSTLINAAVHYGL